MPPINEDDPARQAALALSGRLGRLAATAPAIRPRAVFPRPGVVFPLRLTSILGHLRQQAHEHAMHKLRAHEFIHAP
jgi:hypothetical protein